MLFQLLVLIIDKINNLQNVQNHKYLKGRVFYGKHLFLNLRLRFQPVGSSGRLPVCKAFTSEKGKSQRLRFQPVRKGGKLWNKD